MQNHKERERERPLLAYSCGVHLDFSTQEKKNAKEIRKEKKSKLN